MTSIVTNILFALPISLLLTILGIFAKVFFDLILPMLLHPQIGIASSLILNPKILIVIEPIVFLAVFLILQWRSGKHNLNLK